MVEGKYDLHVFEASSSRCTYLAMKRGEAENMTYMCTPPRRLQASGLRMAWARAGPAQLGTLHSKSNLKLISTPQRCSDVLGVWDSVGGYGLADLDA